MESMRNPRFSMSVKWSPKILSEGDGTHSQTLGLFPECGFLCQRHQEGGRASRSHMPYFPHLNPLLIRTAVLLHLRCYFQSLSTQNFSQQSLPVHLFYTPAKIFPYGHLWGLPLLWYPTNVQDDPWDLLNVRVCDPGGKNSAFHRTRIVWGAKTTSRKAQELSELSLSNIKEQNFNKDVVLNLQAGKGLW